MDYDFYDDECSKDGGLMEENHKNKSLITFAKLHKYFIIPFLFVIFNVISNLFLSFIDDTGFVKKSEYIYSVLYDLPITLAGLFHFLSYFKGISNEKKELTNNKGQLHMNNSNNKSMQRRNKIIIIFFILLGLMNAMIDLLWAIIHKATISQEKLFYLFFIPLFSKIILKENMYKHQYLA